MTELELIELCSLGESTTVQYKLEFTTQKQIAEELVAFANTRGGMQPVRGSHLAHYPKGRNYYPKGE